MKSIIYLLILVSLSTLVNSQALNQITIQPENPTITDTVLIISDLSYLGNCEYGQVGDQTYQDNFDIEIFTLYCGFGDSTLCNSIDTFYLFDLLEGEYNISIEFHQGSVCPISGFDELIEEFDTIIAVSTTSIIPVTPFEEYINLYPNPSTGILNFETNIPAQDIRYIKIFNFLGQEVEIENSNTSIHFMTINPGIYFVKFCLKSNQLIYKKIILSELK